MEGNPLLREGGKPFTIGVGGGGREGNPLQKRREEEKSSILEVDD